MGETFKPDKTRQATFKVNPVEKSTQHPKDKINKDIVPVKQTGTNSEKKDTYSQQSQIDSLTSPVYSSAYISKTFSITNMRGKTVFSCDAQSLIYFNSNRVRVPLSCKEYGIFLQKYLTTSPASKLLIIGSMSDLENTQTGLNRATFVKNLLLRTGIKPDQIETASRLEPLEFKNGAATGGIKMVLLD